MLTVGSAFAHTGLVGEAETVDDLVILAEETTVADAVTVTVTVETVLVTGATVRVL